MIKCQILGRVGKDAELITLPTGLKIVKFSVSHSEGHKDKQTGRWENKGVWVNCAKFFGEGMVDRISDRIKKGDLIYCDGYMSASAYTAKDGSPASSLELRVDNIEFLTAKTKGDDLPF